MLAAFAFGPAVTVIIVTQWCKMEKDGQENKKKRRLPCLSTKPKPDTRTECPKCRAVRHRRVIRTYTQPGVAVWRYYKCKEADENGKVCNQPFRQPDYFSDRV